MQTLESLRRNIDSSQEMQSIVTTMKTLAAVSIRRYEAAVEALTDYNRTIEMGFQILFRDRPLSAAATGAPGAGIGAVVFGSNQGLCGQFNDEMASFALRAMRRSETAAQKWAFLTVGMRMHGRLQEAGAQIDDAFDLPSSISGITPLVQNLLTRIETWRPQREIGRVLVFYNMRTSAASYRSHRIQLLPIEPSRLEDWRTRDWPSRLLPTFRMDRNQLFSLLIRQYLFVALYRACAESMASENASRIASMQAAEKNIEERLEKLRRSYQQQRQTSITEELLDVVTGFEALRGRPRSESARP